MSAIAIESLRRNEATFRVPETDVDIWHQLRLSRTELAKCHKSIDKIKYNTAIIKLKANLGQRIQQISNIPEYVAAIDRLMDIPGLHSELKSANFVSFSKSRAIEVRLTMLQLGMPSFSLCSR
jgi:hypothetical protein